MLRTIPQFRTLRIGIRLLPLVLGTLLVIQPGALLREAAGEPAPSKEYQVKAALLLNFAQFIEWPAAAFHDASTPITVGILGDDPFGPALDQTFQDETIQNRKFVIKRSRQVADLKDCHLVFVSKSESDRLGDILTALNDSSAVTVGETDGFAKRGGIINFFLENNKVHFEINADNAQRKGIKISSQLLKRARLVQSNG